MSDVEDDFAGLPEEEDDLHDLEDEDEDEEEAPRTKGKKRKSAFIDDAAEEDDEEEEDVGPGRKKKTKKVNQFIDDIADVDDDDEVEEEEGDDVDDLIVRDEEAPEEVDYSKYRRAPEMEQRQGEPTAEDMEKYIQERYQQRQVEAVDVAEADAVNQQSLLPTLADPKLWLIRIRPGHEREFVVQVLQKSHNKAGTQAALQITAAFCLDTLPGFAYVEARKESYVRDAMQGLRTSFMSKGVTLVPLNQMVDAITVNKKAKAPLSTGAFVRIRTGIYKGDLAQIDDLDTATGRAVVKVVPREDYIKMGQKERSVPFGKRPTVVQSARPFNPEEARQAGCTVDVMRNDADGNPVFAIGTRRFKNGYLLKNQGIKGLYVDESPPFEELQKFLAAANANRDTEDAPDANAALARAGKAPKAAFTKGDRVIVIKGDLLNLVGTVAQIADDGRIMLAPEHESLSSEDLIPVEQQDVQKYIVVGSHVKVLGGKHIGETGMVIKVDGKVCSILSDASKEEFKAFVSDLTESFDTVTAAESIGQYQLHQAVMLTDNTLGMIISVEADTCHVLTNMGPPGKPDVRLVRLADIRKGINTKSYTTSDRFNNQIGVDDMVTCNDPQYRGKIGTVKHIWKGFCWIHCREIMVNSGYIVVRGRQCQQKGGKNRGDVRTPGSSAGLMTPSRFPASPGHMLAGLKSPAPFMSPAPHRSPAHPSSSPRNDSGRGGMGGAPQSGAFSGRAAHARRDESLMGQTIKIRGGGYRGYRGRVIQATPTHVRVELEANSKTVTVERKFVADPNESNRSGRSGQGMQSMRTGIAGPGYAPATPLHGGRTPMHPSYGSATPMHSSMGGMTPLHPSQGMTPSSYEPARTPMDNYADTPGGVAYTPSDDIGRTPVGTTPYYNSATPGNAYTPHAYTPADTPGAATPGGMAAPTPGTPGYGTAHYGDGMTPGCGADDGVAPTPGIGATPGIHDVGTPGAGTPGGLLVRTPQTVGPMQTPGTAYGTPGIGPTPGTPGGMDTLAPGVGASVEGGVDVSAWARCQVEIRSMNAYGVVRSTGTNGMVTVEVGTLDADNELRVEGGALVGGRVVDVPLSDITLTLPKKKDRIKILSGEHVGETGDLIGVSDTDGIVKLTEKGDDITILVMKSLGKLVL